MSDPDNPLDWVSYAEEDFSAAKMMLRQKKPLLLSSCFHSQQCAEKYPKAVLVAQNVDFPKTHDIPMLDTLCNQLGVFTGFDKSMLAKLSEHAVHTRYPGIDLTLEEARESFEIVKIIRKFSRKWLGIK